MATGVNNAAALAANPQIASITNAINALDPTGNAQAQMNAILGGGGAAPAANTTGGAAAAANALTGAAGGTAATANNQQMIQGTTLDGKVVNIVKDASGNMQLVPATNRLETVMVEGKTLRFDAKGKKTTAFQQAISQPFNIEFDRRDGISSGLTNLSRVFGARQQRLQMISEALATDTNETGSPDPAAVQQLSIEANATEQISLMQKKIFDSMNQAIQAWLR